MVSFYILLSLSIILLDINMENDDKYKILSEGITFKPSVMGAICSRQDYSFTFNKINNKLQESTDFKLISFELSKATDHIEKEYIAIIEYLSETYKLNISEASVEDLRLEEFGLANMINEDDFNTALSQTKYLNVAVNFGKKPLDSFHFQLKVLNAIVPEASLVIDFM